MGMIFGEYEDWYEGVLHFCPKCDAPVGEHMTAQCGKCDWQGLAHETVKKRENKSLKSRI